MKKIPTLFERVYFDHKVIDILPVVTPGCEEALLNGIATVKWDGACCAIIDGEFYKRYDAKKGKKAPEGAIPCCDPDPVTGHWPHWVKVDKSKPADKWFVEAYNRSIMSIRKLPAYSTWEAVGKHFNGNPYGMALDYLIPHANKIVDVRRDFDSIKEYLRGCPFEGIVFWLNGEPVCKIKRSDFGFEWPIKTIMDIRNLEKEG